MLKGKWKRLASNPNKMSQVEGIFLNGIQHDVELIKSRYQESQSNDPP